MITSAIFMCPSRARPGRAGPVFKLDRGLLLCLQEHFRNILKSFFYLKLDDSLLDPFFRIQRDDDDDVDDEIWNLL